MSMLPSSNLIPTVLTNAAVYKDGGALLGVGSVEMPNFEYMTESIAGLGIAGELDTPVTGHFKSMSLKIKWNSTSEAAMQLLEGAAHQIDVRGSIQKYDAGSGKYIDEPVKVVVKGPPKNVGIGKFEPGKKMEPETELEVYYLKLWQNGKESVEVDKLNFIFRLNGVDKLAQVRRNLGMD